jgi:hypothetical protein
MAIETVNMCPFGMQACERVVDGKVHRCVLYLEMITKNNITSEESKTSNCTFNWQTILQNESNARITGVQAATEDFRNQVVGQQSMLLGAINTQGLLE